MKLTFNTSKILNVYSEEAETLRGIVSKHMKPSYTDNIETLKEDLYSCMIVDLKSASDEEQAVLKQISDKCTQKDAFYFRIIKP